MQGMTGLPGGGPTFVAPGLPGGAQPLGGGGGHDPYVVGGMGSSLSLDRVWVAKDTYWNIRRSSPNIRTYLSLYFPGSKAGAIFRELWMGAEIIDLELDRAYRIEGLAGVERMLAYSDTCEHLLARLGAEVSDAHNGDANMYRELQTARPPGEADILPTSALTAARDASRTAYYQGLRVKGGDSRGDGEQYRDGNNEDEAARRRRGPGKYGKQGDGKQGKGGGVPPKAPG